MPVISSVVDQDTASTATVTAIATMAATGNNTATPTRVSAMANPSSDKYKPSISLSTPSSIPIIVNVDVDATHNTILDPLATAGKLLLINCSI
jgi:hypothetical protein